MRYFRILLLLLKAALLFPLVLVLRLFRPAAAASVALPPLPDNIDEFDWPPLPEEGFLAGRGATRADVTADLAVFSFEQSNGPTGEPLPIPIPQFALWFDDQANRFEPVIVVQAERGGSLEIVGLRGADGSQRVVGKADVHLLGRSLVNRTSAHKAG